MYKFLFILLFLCSFIEAKIHLVATFPIYKEIIEKIAKNDFVIHIIKSDIKNFKNLHDINQDDFIFSSVFFTFGLDEEKRYIEFFKSKNKKMKIVDASKGIKKDIVNEKENPYVWMDPLLLRKIAMNIYGELLNLEPSKKLFLQKNLKNFLDEIDEIFLTLKEKLDGLQYYNIYVYEPYWHYYAKRFSLNLFYQPNRFLKPQELMYYIKEAKKNNIKRILISKNIALYNMVYSLAKQINAKIIQSDIFDFDYGINIFSLSRQISQNNL